MGFGIGNVVSPYIGAEILRRSRTGPAPTLTKNPSNPALDQMKADLAWKREQREQGAYDADMKERTAARKNQDALLDISRDAQKTNAQKAEQEAMLERQKAAWSQSMDVAKYQLDAATNAKDVLSIVQRQLEHLTKPNTDGKTPFGDAYPVQDAQADAQAFMAKAYGILGMLSGNDPAAERMLDAEAEAAGIDPSMAKASARSGSVPPPRAPGTGTPPAQPSRPYDLAVARGQVMKPRHQTPTVERDAFLAAVPPEALQALPGGTRIVKADPPTIQTHDGKMLFWTGQGWEDNPTIGRAGKGKGGKVGDRASDQELSSVVTMPRK